MKIVILRNVFSHCKAVAVDCFMAQFDVFCVSKHRELLFSSFGRVLWKRFSLILIFCQRREKKFVKRYTPRDQRLATAKRLVSNQLELEVSVRKDGENGRIDRHQSLENGYLKSFITIERNKKLANGDI